MNPEKEDHGETLPRGELEGLYLTGYRAVGLGLGCLCVALACAFPILSPGPLGHLRAGAFGAYGLVFLLGALAIQRGLLGVRQVLPFALGISLLTTLGAFSPMLLPPGSSTNHDLGIAVVMVGFGVGIPRTPWLLGFLLVVVAARAGLGLQRPDLQGSFGPWLLHLLMAGVVAVTVHLLVRRLVEAQARLRAKDRRLVAQLQQALDNLRTLQGLIPICAHCKKVRDDEGYWQQVEHYVEERSSAEFTHGICPECAVEARRELEDMVRPPRGPTC